MAAVVWFRCDLRTVDNPALDAACENNDKVYGIFLVPQETWVAHDWAPIKVDLWWRHLAEFKDELAEKGIGFSVFVIDRFNQSGARIADFCEQHGVTRVYANREYPLDEVDRDKRAQACFQHRDIELSLFDGNLLVAPAQVKTKQGGYYKVFTPFNRAWRTEVNKQDDWATSQWTVADTVDTATEIPPCPLERKDSQAYPVGRQAIMGKLGQFIEHQVADYKAKRDQPSVDGTSMMSAYFEMGAIAPKTVARALTSLSPEFPYGLEPGADTWLTEVAWREFYQHLMFHEPRLSRGENYQTETQGLPWRQAEDDFQAWCEGRTGFPIVDAGMRQLNETGWMHNRLRMIVANFLVKDLLIDWRKGEQYFMQNLIDGSFPANNGGWQWSASVGTDAVPYFRVFNPVRQSEKFDPDGTYIRTWVKELADVPSKHIHWPHSYLKQRKTGYVSPIVDHSEARERFLSTFKQVKNG